MHQRSVHRILLSICLVSVPVLVLGCGPSDPVEAVQKARRQYTVKLNTWLPQNQVEAAEPGAEGEAPDAEVGEEPVAGEEAAGDFVGLEEVPEEIEGPRPTSILFDVIVRFEGSRPLPGITLDITHADPFDEVKEVRRHYIDTSGFRDGTTEQISIVLDGWSFEEGDQFALELREHVPPEDQDEYRELQEAA